MDESKKKKKRMRATLMHTDREGMEGVANLKRTVKPGFAHNMIFEQGCEKVREQTTEHLGEEHFRQRE